METPVLERLVSMGLYRTANCLRCSLPGNRYPSEFSWKATQGPSECTTRLLPGENLGVRQEWPNLQRIRSILLPRAPSLWAEQFLKLPWYFIQQQNLFPILNLTAFNFSKQFNSKLPLKPPYFLTIFLYMYVLERLVLFSQLTLQVEFSTYQL